MTEGGQIPGVGSTAVLPCLMWWTCSHLLRSHPGTRHPLSRSSITIRVRSGTVRKARPTLTALPPASSTGRMRASHPTNRRSPSLTPAPRWRCPFVRHSRPFHKGPFVCRQLGRELPGAPLRGGEADLAGLRRRARLLGLGRITRRLVGERVAPEHATKPDHGGRPGQCRRLGVGPAGAWRQTTATWSSHSPPSSNASRVSGSSASRRAIGTKVLARAGVVGFGPWR